MELRPLSNVDFTQRHNPPSSRPLQFGGAAASSASAAVRLRHSRLRLLNEIDAAAGPAAPAAADPDDTAAAGAGSAAAATASTSTSAARTADWREANRRRREVLAEFRRRAALTLRQRMPVVRDVNKIDRYSRTAFPVLFVVFNVAYWVYYLVHKTARVVD